MIKFDSLNKKPKLWNVAVLTAAAAAAIAALVLSYAQKNMLYICLVLDAYFLIVVILLVRAFFRQLRYNLYSYNTVFYIGFAIFLVFVFITYVILTVNVLRYSDLFTVHYFISVLLESATNYVIITFPFLAVFSALLCISNVSLLRHEGKRIVNFLGIALSFVLIGGAAFLFFFNRYATGSQTQVMIHDMITYFFAAAYLYFECMLIGVIIGNIIAVRREPDRNIDFMIILGCGLKKDGSPTPLLRGRIERAMAFDEKQREETGRELTFITSGGKGSDEINSESASMKKYLIEHGIPESRIVEEDRSRDTFENMKNSKQIIDGIAPEVRIAYATTNYHVFRSGIFARRVKMRAAGIGAKTKWYFWPNAAVREFIGLLTKHRVKQGLIFGGMVLFYIVLTYINYNY